MQESTKQDILHAINEIKSHHGKNNKKAKEANDMIRFSTVSNKSAVIEAAKAEKLEEKGNFDICNGLWKS